MHDARQGLMAEWRLSLDTWRTVPLPWHGRSRVAAVDAERDAHDWTRYRGDEEEPPLDSTMFVVYIYNNFVMK